jgi:hypothetical protein
LPDKQQPCASACRAVADDTRLMNPVSAVCVAVQQVYKAGQQWLEGGSS